MILTINQWLIIILCVIINNEIMSNKYCYRDKWFLKNLKMSYKCDFECTDKPCTTSNGLPLRSA